MYIFTTLEFPTHITLNFIYIYIYIYIVYYLRYTEIIINKLQY